LHFHICAKWPNFIQLPSTLTKLYHIKCDHLVNFYSSVEKCEKSWYICNSMTNLHNIWHDDAVSSALPIKTFNLKNPRWRAADTLEWPILHRHEILQFVSFQESVAVRHLGILKLNFLTANHFKDLFWIITLNFVISLTVSEILHFFVFFKWNVKIN